MHAAFVPEMGNKIRNIELHIGHRMAYTKGMGGNREFREQLKPIRQIQDRLIRVHMPVLHSSLVDITSALPNTLTAWRDMIGLLTSRPLFSTVEQSNILIIRIVFIVCVVYCHLACLPSLGLKIHVPPGKFVFFRSYLLPYDITASSEHRLCTVSFMKQAVVDFYNQEMGVM